MLIGVLIWLSTYQQLQLTQLEAAIIQVESGGNQSAVGDGGKAVGILQIHKCMVDDVNRILGRQEFTYDDRTCPHASIRMFRIYTNHYSYGCTDEIKARRWNGGPKGELKKATDSYWIKVKQQIKA